MDWFIPGGSKGFEVGFDFFLTLLQRQIHDFALLTLHAQKRLAASHSEGQIATQRPFAYFGFRHAA